MNQFHRWPEAARSSRPWEPRLVFDFILHDVGGIAEHDVIALVREFSDIGAEREKSKSRLECGGVLSDANVCASIENSARRKSIGDAFSERPSTEIHRIITGIENFDELMLSRARRRIIGGAKMNFIDHRCRRHVVGGREGIADGRPRRARTVAGEEAEKIRRGRGQAADLLGEARRLRTEHDVITPCPCGGASIGEAIVERHSRCLISCRGDLPGKQGIGTTDGERS